MNSESQQMSHQQMDAIFKQIMNPLYDYLWSLAFDAILSALLIFLIGLAIHALIHSWQWFVYPVPFRQRKNHRKCNRIVNSILKVVELFIS